jgi:rare lipoprotein A
LTLENADRFAPAAVGFRTLSVMREVFPLSRRPREESRLRGPCFVLLGAVLALTAVPAASELPTAGAFDKAVLLGINAVQEGLVSWYGAAFNDRPTASGERFDSDGFTMAHPTLPFGTEVKVTNLRNGRSVVVRVNDRGPHVGKRIADLSRAAAAEIGMLRRGVVRARIEVLEQAGRGA